MKPDHLTAEVTADSLDGAVEKTITRPDRQPGRLGNRLARMLDRRTFCRAGQPSKPAATPPLDLNERRILHNLFRQETGHESRSKDSTWDCQAVVPQKRG